MFYILINHSRLGSRLSLVSSNEGSVISRSVEIFVVSEVGLWTGASAYYSLSSLLTRIYRCDGDGHYRAAVTGQYQVSGINNLWVD